MLCLSVWLPTNLLLAYLNVRMVKNKGVEVSDIRRAVLLKRSEIDTCESRNRLKIFISNDASLECSDNLRTSKRTHHLTTEAIAIISNSSTNFLFLLPVRRGNG